MLKKTQKNIRKYQLFTPNDRLIVAVSGGGDSCVLLHILLSLGYKCVIAHCNFHLRGEESMRDEAFVQQLARYYNCPFRKVDFQTEEHAKKHKISIEMAARELRYEWFEQIRLEENASCTAVAHHSDDVVETILMNLTRGTGINGLTGIKVKNGSIVRPLLEVSHEEIMQYAEKNHLRYVVDSTNNDNTFVRNRFRNEIIPLLKTINHAFTTNLLHTSEHLNDVAGIYNDYISQIKQQILSSSNGDITISIEKLKKEKGYKSILFEILKEYQFNSQQCISISKSLDGSSGKQFFSPSHKLLKDRDTLIITKQEEPFKSFIIPETAKLIEYPLLMKFEIIEEVDVDKIGKSTNVVYLDFDKLTFPLTLRHWQRGDSFFPFGMKNRKKLSDFYIDEKYTLNEKENSWILVSGEEIAWIVGKRLDNRFRITKETKKMLKIIC